MKLFLLLYYKKYMSSRSKTTYSWDDKKEDAWKAVKTINPFTGKPITMDGPTYQNLEESYMKYITKLAQIQKELAPKKPLTPAKLEMTEQALAIIATHRPQDAPMLSVLNKGIYQYTKNKNLSTIGKQIREEGFLPLAFVEKLIHYIFEKEKKELFSPIQHSSLESVDKEVVLLIRQEVIYHLQIVRDYTRERSMRMTLKPAVLNIPSEESPDAVLKKLKTWCKVHRLETVYNAVENNYRKRIIPDIEKELIEYIYRYYNISRTIATIYAYYILGNLHYKLAYLWRLEMEKRRRIDTQLTKEPIQFSEKMLYTDVPDKYRATQYYGLTHVISYSQLYSLLEPIFNVNNERFHELQEMINDNPININYQLYNPEGTIKYFVEILQDLTSRNPVVVPKLIKMISKKKVFIPPLSTVPVETVATTSTSMGGRRINKKK